ncbi:MAG TPA: hypothetical protein VNU44_19845 [Bryobacteraceae bacterium]|jgi:hypothetical protein|nr:hypothetical protein [Bryobacteraceae bacterium]
MIVIFVKSILAGIGVAAIVGLAIAIYAQGLQYRAVMSERPGDSAYVETHWHPVPVLCTLLVAFAAGFWWQFRKPR